MSAKGNGWMLWLAFVGALLVMQPARDGCAAELIKVYAVYGGIAGYQLPLWINKERANLDGIRNILKEMDAAQRNPNDFIDMSLLDEIEKRGVYATFAIERARGANRG